MCIIVEKLANIIIVKEVTSWNLLAQSDAEFLVVYVNRCTHSKFDYLLFHINENGRNMYRYR